MRDNDGERTVPIGPILTILQAPTIYLLHGRSLRQLPNRMTDDGVNATAGGGTMFDWNAE